MSPVKDGARDLESLSGSWNVRHRRLTRRLAGSEDWARFDGDCATQPALGGAGNTEDNLLLLPGGADRAAALPSDAAASGKWAIWWLDWAQSPSA